MRNIIVNILKYTTMLPLILLMEFARLLAKGFRLTSLSEWIDDKAGRFIDWFFKVTKHETISKKTYRDSKTS